MLGYYKDFLVKTKFELFIWSIFKKIGSVKFYVKEKSFTQILILS